MVKERQKSKSTTNIFKIFKSVKGVIIISLIVLGLILTYYQAFQRQNYRQNAATGGLWVTGWYAGWLQNYMPPSAIDFSVITHVNHFVVVPNNNGTLNTNQPGFESQNISNLVNTAHSAGRKVLYSVGGVTGYTGFSSSITSTYRATFINNLVTFMNTNNYDGIDIDMEPIQSGDITNFQAFINDLRTAMGTTKTLTVAGPPTGNAAICGVQDKFDQINIMTYDMSGAWGGWITWHNAPVYNGGAVFPSNTSRPLPSAEVYQQPYLTSGCLASKLAIGIDFYGYIWRGGAGTDTGGVTKPKQSWTTAPTVQGNVAYYDLARTYNLSQALWDSTAQAAYISIDQTGSSNDQFVSFDNEQSVAAKVEFARRFGNGGIAIWELAAGYLPSGNTPRDPLIQALKQAINNGTSATNTPAASTPTPIPPTPSTAQNTPTTLPNTPTPTSSTSQDNINPTVMIEYPLNGAIVTGKVRIKGIGYDNVKVIKIQVFVDSVLRGTSNSDTLYASWDSRRSTSGQHSIEVKAYDAAGNVGTKSIVVTKN